MTKSLRSCGLIAALLFSCAAASAATYDFTYYGNGVDAAGDFVVNSADQITSIAGVYGDVDGLFGKIDGLVALNSDAGFNYDNSYNHGFDLGGVLFDVNGQHVNLFTEGGQAHSYTYANSFGDSVVKLSVTEICSAVPEPSEMALFAAGLLGLGFVSKRKASKI